MKKAKVLKEHWDVMLISDLSENDFGEWGVDVVLKDSQRLKAMRMIQAEPIFREWIEKHCSGCAVAFIFQPSEEYGWKKGVAGFIVPKNGKRWSRYNFLCWVNGKPHLGNLRKYTLKIKWE